LLRNVQNVIVHFAFNLITNGGNKVAPKSKFHDFVLTPAIDFEQIALKKGQRAPKGYKEIRINRRRPSGRMAAGQALPLPMWVRQDNPNRRPGGDS